MEYGLGDIDIVAQWLLETAQNRNCTAIALQGEMGSGKTTLAKALFARLGVKTAVTSPTFALVNTYQIEGIKVFHFDFYRLKSEQEAFDIGAHELMQSGFSVVEWPELAKNAIPETVLWVLITAKSSDKREIRILDEKPLV